MYLDDTIAAFQIYLRVSNIDGFQSWLRDFHKTENLENFFLGYRYFLEVCSILLVNEFSEYESFGVNSDEIYLAARQRGLDLEDIPNSCERVVFLKNIWNFFDPIRSAEDWDDLKKTIKKTKTVTKIFNKIFDNCEVKGNLSKEIATDYVTLYFAHHRLNDTQRGSPIGAVGGLTKPSIDRPEIEYFKGYAYALEYLWFICLGKESFENSPAKYIHDPLLAMSPDAVADLKNYEALSEPDDLKTQQKRIAWDSLDNLFHPLFDIHLSNLWKEGKLSNPTTFYFQKKYDEKLVAPLLNQSTVNDPTYLFEDTSEEGLSKKIDYHFRWCEVTVVGSGYQSDCFGTFAFIPFLLGITTSKKVTQKNRVPIIRFRHPDENGNGYVYSYAVLNQGFFFNDYGEGWLIFLTIGNDVSGHGGSMYREVEKYIKNFDDQGILDIRQIDIDENDFKNYLRKKVDFLYENTDTPIEILITFLENEKVEFKSSLLWSYIKNQRSETSEYEVMRAIASFLNTDGGTLLIGVGDAGTIIGLEKDYSMLGANRHKNRDGFSLYLHDKIEHFLGKTNTYYIRIRFEDIGDKDVCRIEVSAADEPVFLKIDNRSEFIMRSGPASKSLPPNEFYAYLQKHWGLRKIRHN